MSLKMRTTCISVATSVTKFEAILFTPIVHTYLGVLLFVDSEKSGLPCVATVATLPPQPQRASFIRQNIQTVYLYQLTNTVPDTVRFVYGSKRS